MFAFPQNDLLGLGLSIQYFNLMSVKHIQDLMDRGFGGLYSGLYVYVNISYFMVFFFYDRKLYAG